MKQCLDEIDLGISDEEMINIFNSIDEDGSGLIEYQEFIRNACDIKKLMNDNNLKNVFPAICGVKEIMTAEDIKWFVFHDSLVNEQILKEYFNQIGITIEDQINFDDFSNMINNNCKYKAKDEQKLKFYKKESKYAFTGPVIAEDEEKLEEDDVELVLGRNLRRMKKKMEELRKMEK